MTDADVVIMNQCECKKVSFTKIKEYGNYYAAMGATGCGSECGNCIPYIKLMFATGETEFRSDDPRVEQYKPAPVDYGPDFDY